MPESETAKSVKKTLRLLTYATVFLYIASILFTAWFWMDSRNKASDIQQERKASILRACLDQNTRHDLTIKFIDEQIDKLPTKQKIEAQVQRNTTILFISALAPHQDCDKVVQRSVG